MWSLVIGSFNECAQDSIYIYNVTKEISVLILVTKLVQHHTVSNILCNPILVADFIHDITVRLLLSLHKIMLGENTIFWLLNAGIDCLQ